MTIGFDETDRALVGLLRQDGRMPGPKLSKALGISLVTVHRRIKRLLDEGAIGITAFPDLGKAGTECATLYGLNVSENSIGDIISKLLEHPAVVRVSKTEGRFNLICFVVFKRVSELSVFHINVIPEIEGVYYYESMVILLPEAAKSLDLTDLEKKIFEQLRNQGRVSSTEIAKRLGVSINIVRSRIKRLVSQDRLINVRAVINPEKMDWFCPAIIGVKTRQQSVALIMGKLSGELPVRQVVPTLGRYNIAIFTQFGSETELFRFIDDKIRMTEGVIDCEVYKENTIRYGRNYFVKSGRPESRSER